MRLDGTDKPAVLDFIELYENLIRDRKRINSDIRTIQVAMIQYCLAHNLEFYDQDKNVLNVSRLKKYLNNL
jgi:hypothetical protein